MIEEMKDYIEKYARQNHISADEAESHKIVQEVEEEIIKESPALKKRPS